MNYEEALNLLVKEHKEDRDWTKESLEAVHLLEECIKKKIEAEEALKLVSKYGGIEAVKSTCEKQIQKKPDYREVENIYGTAFKRTCAECGDEVTISEAARPFENYCRFCGKRLTGTE